MLPIIYFLKYLFRSGIRTNAYSCRLRPERSALDHEPLTTPTSHVAYYILPKIFIQKRDSNPRLQLNCDLNAAR